MSPLIFPKNVMETVAVGVAQLELPMIFKIPRLSSSVTSVGVSKMPFFANVFLGVFDQFDANLTQLYASGFLMLGLGDIVLPGLALNYFYRRDKMLQQALESHGIVSPKFRLTFYSIAQFGYTFGLVLTFIMLILLKRAQPALLYLVPCTLIPPFLLAAKRGQLSWLWRSLPVPERDIENDESEVSSEPTPDDTSTPLEQKDETNESDDSPICLEDSNLESQPLTLESR
jgi:hypothetical protein